MDQRFIASTTKGTHTVDGTREPGDLGPIQQASPPSSSNTHTPSPGCRKTQASLTPPLSTLDLMTEHPTPFQHRFAPKRLLQATRSILQPLNFESVSEVANAPRVPHGPLVSPLLFSIHLTPPYRSPKISTIPILLFWFHHQLSPEAPLDEGL